MLIVADTSPLNYLILIGTVEVLPKLYGRVLIPEQVRDELLDPHTPLAVRLWFAAMPQWLEVKNPKVVDNSLCLDEAEAAAIALAQELHADRLLIDERDGRTIAIRLGIPVAGTLAVLLDAAVAGQIDLQAALEQLKQTTFRASPRLFEQVLLDFEKNRNR